MSRTRYNDLNNINRSNSAWTHPSEYKFLHFGNRNFLQDSKGKKACIFAQPSLLYGLIIFSIYIFLYIYKTFTKAKESHWFSLCHLTCQITNLGCFVQRCCSSLTNPADTPPVYLYVCPQASINAPPGGDGEQ